jgi:sigma-B regulation protein RsbU (phosphoserine phosphatase)
MGLFRSTPYVLRQITLEPDDVVVLFSDGVTEAQDRTGEEFGDERLLQCLTAVRGCPIQEQLQTVHRVVCDHCHHGVPQDDLTMVFLRVESAIGADR